MKPVLFVLLLVACVVGSMLQQPTAHAKDASLVGVYACKGMSPEGKPYEGTAEIIETGSTLHIRWTLQPDDAHVVGVCLTVGKHLACSYIINGRPGVAVYEVKGDTLKGRWTAGGADEAWGETLTRRKADQPRQQRQHVKPDPKQHRAV